jgi:hypothetical protein
LTRSMRDAGTPGIGFGFVGPSVIQASPVWIGGVKHFRGQISSDPGQTRKSA